MHIAIRTAGFSMMTMFVSCGVGANFTATPQEARGIAKEAYLYGFPVVEMYKTLYTQAVDKKSSNFKAPFNQIGNTAKAFTAKDTAFVSPNADTPYSFVWMDLRAEPLVLTLPRIDEHRYYSVQLIDAYTQNFAYLGTRSTGNSGGHFMVAGPNWQGQQPLDIDRLLRSETNIAYALYRTQLLDEKDLAKVKQIQKGYKVETLSRYDKHKAPPAAAKIDWPKPMPTMSDTPDLFRYLNFMLAFAPAQDVEKDLLARFKTIGIEAGKPFDLIRLSADQRKALEDGISDAKAEFAELQKTKFDTHELSSSVAFGTRDHLNGNYLYRYAGANMGIFGNSAEEANYIPYFVDKDSKPLDASKHDYTLHFDKGALPPAEAFWSLTMYNAKNKLLVANPLNRYLINSPMVPDLKVDADGGLTLYLQNKAPAKDLQSNWLPAPNGPFYSVLRLYLPTPAVASGQWQMPSLTPVNQQKQ
ncbi:DUF1254 domain-containing protein [Pseudomonas sp. PCH199]|uniref:DUF1254 domain-containing protein n=1 Tax=unclassified Pseudomonas TaxID=196821 RepID=UPI000BD564A4|nr:MULTISPECIES: DUF1254 domain-containing protein [unclassified Pseudomonas]MCW8278870.1 DUF1254 domain-containing protein [Pseudomonas sp. PCH199]PAM79824.1 cell envelope protein [Pseudomonas sp. ERMR1:02]